MSLVAIARCSSRTWLPPVGWTEVTTAIGQPATFRHLATGRHVLDLPDHVATIEEAMAVALGYEFAHAAGDCGWSVWRAGGPMVLTGFTSRHEAACAVCEHDYYRRLGEQP